MLPFNPLPTLSVGPYQLVPLQPFDFEEVYEAASDPEVWAQHPNKNRYEREVFKNFFEGAIESGGAFKIVDTHTDKVIGSTRIYDYDPDKKSILIGYTFLAKGYWGKGANPMIKRLLLDFLFQYIDVVLLHIGAQNIRSQISIERLGANKVDKIKIAYYGEPEKENFVYEFRKENWK
jgi:RimJ/RimL family protein N-acetyltransferase